MLKNKVIDLELSVLKSERIDIIIVDVLLGHSRSQIQNWIKSGYVTINNVPIFKPKYKASPKDHLHVKVTLEERTVDAPQNMSLNVIFEDNAILILNKPVGLVTHPGAGIDDNTLMNGLLYHCPDNKLIPRAGIVHRLDKDTSGIMVIAKTNESYNVLVDAFKSRKVEKNYQALVYGQFKLSKTIDLPIGRHPQQRTKMTVLQKGKNAVTNVKILKRFIHFTHLMINIETGRTHQIRVHLSHEKHPIIGDSSYGRKPNYVDLDQSIKTWLDQQKSQLLHAYKLSFNHPETNELMTFEIPLEENFEEGLNLFNQYD